MKIGTKSVIFGAHCWFIHPWFVAVAWWRLFGFPRDWQLWMAFFLHDLGYVGKPDMDGDEGECHVEWGAHALGQIAARVATFGKPDCIATRIEGSKNYHEWNRFSLYHSRFYAKRDGAEPSRLCIADKLAVALEPWWLYLPRVIATGEIHEYMARAGGQQGSKYDGEPVVSKYLSMGVGTRTKRQWHSDMTEYLRKWVEEHKDGRADTWTPEAIAKDSPNTTAPMGAKDNS